jgi:hypothetical protein
LHPELCFDRCHVSLAQRRWQNTPFDPAVRIDLANKLQPSGAVLLYGSSALMMGLGFAIKYIELPTERLLKLYRTGSHPVGGHGRPIWKILRLKGTHEDFASCRRAIVLLASFGQLARLSLTCQLHPKLA